MMSPTMRWVTVYSVILIGAKGEAFGGGHPKTGREEHREHPNLHHLSNQKDLIKNFSTCGGIFEIRREHAQAPTSLFQDMTTIPSNNQKK